MRDLRRVGGIAIVLLVLLRMSIGWQFLYEGLWKINTLSSPRPWTAEGYLKNAQGPFRNYFRNMTGDPDDLAWLEFDVVSSRWDDWKERFLAHHPDLTDRQKARLDQLLDGPPRFYVKVEDPLPAETLEQGLKRFGKVVTWDPDNQLLVADGSLHLLPQERDALLALAPWPTDGSTPEKSTTSWRRAVENLYRLGSRLSYRERLAVMLKADPERVTTVNEQLAGTVDYQHLGKVDIYRDKLKRYEERLQLAETDFQQEHLDWQWNELQQARAELVGPVKALEEEFHTAATALLTAEQQARGPVVPAPTKISQVDWLTIWTLTILGGLLIAGLCSRVAAIAGAGMLLSFYLVMPPWPGVPSAPGPEHSLIINKNLIEALALLALAALPTGTWFGLDAIFYRLFGGGRRAAATGESTPATIDSSSAGSGSTGAATAKTPVATT
ncbi:MAG: hypothetical protein KDA79_13020, partial [Planctomycetaceae bacterium]|nr:hypothetical protein [Planctomycetaceae bacterium]